MFDIILKINRADPYFSMSYGFRFYPTTPETPIIFSTTEIGNLDMIEENGKRFMKNKEKRKIKWTTIQGISIACLKSTQQFIPCFSFSFLLLNFLRSFQYFINIHTQQSSFALLIISVLFKEFLCSKSQNC